MQEMQQSRQTQLTKKPANFNNSCCYIMFKFFCKKNKKSTFFRFSSKLVLCQESCQISYWMSYQLPCWCHDGCHVRCHVELHIQCYVILDVMMLLLEQQIFGLFKKCNPIYRAIFYIFRCNSIISTNWPMNNGLNESCILYIKCINKEKV